MDSLRFWLVTLSAALLITACMMTPPTIPQAESTELRVAVLPITDVIPFYVAQSEGTYAEQGIKVELIPVASGSERDTLLQAGQADCVLNEVLGTILFNAGEGEELRVIATALRAFPEAAHFYLLASPQSRITNVDQLPGRTIAIAENTIIAYWTDRLLARAGIAPDSVDRTSVPRIPVRLELLMNGQVDAAVLPDPLGSLAILGGAPLLLDDTVAPELGLSVISCRASVLAAQPNTVRALLAAWDDAVSAINADPQRFRNILTENTRVPEPLQDRYDLPPFPVEEIPTIAEVEDVVNWALETGLISEVISYEEIVSDARSNPE
ncbi:MAG: ABC transporter substrate-binding protein [Caldilineaceae bacterium]|nr:ABC transporter substrate-binding protein [Caldilineaceae bacterium]